MATIATILQPLRKRGTITPTHGPEPNERSEERKTHAGPSSWAWAGMFASQTHHHKDGPAFLLQLIFSPPLAGPLLTMAATKNNSTTNTQEVCKSWAKKLRFAVCISQKIVSHSFGGALRVMAPWCHNGFTMMFEGHIA